MKDTPRQNQCTRTWTILTPRVLHRHACSYKISCIIKRIGHFLVTRICHARNARLCKFFLHGDVLSQSCKNILHQGLPAQKTSPVKRLFVRWMDRKWDISMVWVWKVLVNARIVHVIYSSIGKYNYYNTYFSPLTAILQEIWGITTADKTIGRKMKMFLRPML